MIIETIIGREILDSRGNPTVEADVILADGSIGRASVPSGASTGSNEALELRDGDEQRYLGLGVLRAVASINGEIRGRLIGGDSAQQRELDQTLIELDGTPTKERLGANALLAISLAAAKAEALSQSLPLFSHVRTFSRAALDVTLPMPYCNVINGGKHAAGSTDIQEFMLVPVGAPTYAEAVRMLAETFHALGWVLAQAGYRTTVGDEGGYAPAVTSGNGEALDLIMQAIERAGYRPGKDLALALDVAASELRRDRSYVLAIEERTLSSDDLVAFYQELTNNYPIVSIEDGLAEDDWDGWVHLTEVLGERVQLVGDDLFVTNVAFLEEGIRRKAGNAILIKPNQIGTLSETIEAVDTAHEAGWRTMLSHRSGETEDTTIAHLSVGLGTGAIKTGSMSRSERIAKYNELLRIEELLGDEARFRGTFEKNQEPVA